MIAMECCFKSSGDKSQVLSEEILIDMFLRHLSVSICFHEPHGILYMKIFSLYSANFQTDLAFTRIPRTSVDKRASCDVI